ncbi:hypothetical protein [Crenalkalicoccus roseus]|uniref:hypothetical protein n=1 Tax=Crenalkalicoccus roseus TaxID=1485588 RepID=UPI00108088C8|nr:hypothetical protein [Crenalkalicoccus roseus]
MAPPTSPACAALPCPAPPCAALSCIAPPCIADVRLSLGPGGLCWVLGLARTLPVWLVETHWAIVEDPFHLEQEGLVRALAALPGEPLEACRAALSAACTAWREARRAWRLEAHANLFWSADRIAEATVPKDGDGGLIDRRDALAAGFDRRQARPPEALDTLADCARDVLALAAALAATPGGRPPLVLTTLAEGEGEPALARSLEAAGIPCRRLDPAWAARFDALLAPALLGAGLGAALGAGALRLAGLQVVAPGALGAGPVNGTDPEPDALAWNAAAIGDEERLWHGAVAACWEVRCAT